MKHSICSLAQVIRSKNAGPYELVLDILFKTRRLSARKTLRAINTAAYCRFI